MSSEKNFPKALITDVTSLQEDTKNLIEGSEITNTSRLMYLKSKQADIHHSPLKKTWIVHDFVKVKSAMHKVNLRNLNLWHLFPSIPEDVMIVTETWSLPISRGNWNAQSLANYINYNLGKSQIDTRFTWDDGLQRFVMCPGITLMPSSTANQYLGFPDDVYRYYTQSVFPPKLSGPWCISLNTNLTLNNIPISGCLACIPLTVEYGSMMQYQNYDMSDASLSLDNNINTITIEICQSDLTSFTNYPEVEWDLCLSFQYTPSAGYQPLQE